MTRVLHHAKIIGHPWVILSGLAFSIFLWMPYGLGYYEWPWANVVCRYSLYAFVVAFPLCCLVSLVQAIRPQIRPARVFLAIVCLTIGVWGAAVLESWRHVYIIPLLK